MDSHKEIPTGGEFGYIARKLSNIDANIREMKTELKYRPNESRVREVAEEVITGKIELCQATHKKTPRSTKIPEHLTGKDWRGLIRLLVIIASLLGIGGSAGYSIKVTQDDHKEQNQEE